MKPKLSPIEREAKQLFECLWKNDGSVFKWDAMHEDGKNSWLRLARRVRKQVKKAEQKSYRKAMSHTLSPMTGLH